MGGNAKAIDRVTGAVKVVNGKEAYAQRVDLRAINVSVFKDDLITLLLALNHEVHYVWPNPISVSVGTMFNGSAEHLFSVPTQTLLKHRTHIGDIDVMVPKHSVKPLFETLCRLEGLRLGRFLFVGQSRPTLRGEQVNTVWYHSDYGFVQLDFVGVNFKGDVPDGFSRFAHSSPWVDVEKGLKGVAHKYLLMVLTWVLHPVHNVVVLTDKSPVWPPDKVRRKVLHQPIRAMSFSVDRGLRERLQVQFRGGIPVRLHDGTAFKELSTESSTYVTDLYEMYARIFNELPHDDELTLMSSFMGLIELCKRNLSPQEVRDVFDQLVRYKLFGPGQALSRDSADEDRQVKARVIGVLVQEFPYLKDAGPSVDDLMTRYYTSYKERAVDE